MNKACTNPISPANLKIDFNNMKIDMKTYYGNTPFQFGPLILAMNLSVGISTADKVFFQGGVDYSNFKVSTMTNFWTSNTPSVDTITAIDLITTFIIFEGDRAVSSSGDDSFANYYRDFINPYANFIINFLFCNINPPINFDYTNDNVNISQNFLRFMNGATTGDFGGTRGGGTITLCGYCSDFLDNNKKTITDKYGYISTNDYIQQFCGCCSFLNDDQPSFYTQNDVSVSLVCQPICHKNEVIKAYNGSIKYVNNGYPSNNNTSSTGTQSYTRRECLGQTICVIDVDSIKLTGGQNKVEFNQVCPGCNQGSSCICYLDTSQGNIDTITDGIDGLQNSVVFNQNCPHSFCSQSKKNSKGVMETVFAPCNVYNPSDTGKNPNNNYSHDGNPSPNSSDDNRTTYIFGIQNWLVPIVFLGILIFVMISLLIVNISSIKKQIFMVKPNNIAMKSFKENIIEEEKDLIKETKL